MENILKELDAGVNIRANLSSLRQLIKEEEAKKELLAKTEGGMALLSYLSAEDAKTRKNAALLLGETGCEGAREALLEAWQKETTQFVKSAYLNALSHLDINDQIGDLSAELERLLKEEVLPENKKHVDEQIRELRKILIQYQGISHHTFSAKGLSCEVLLLCNREQRGAILSTITDGRAKLHPLGILVETTQFARIAAMRTYRELVFPVHTKGFVPAEPKLAAEMLMESDLLKLLSRYHKEDGAFYFRIECKSPMTLEERSAFSKKLSAELERLSGGRLCNSTTDYEVELRLIANREGAFFPCLKLFTRKDKRFSYRKNAIAASIHPSTAALIAELSTPYLKEHAQILDPFCGVGTMLIERAVRVPAGEMYATDIFGEAVEKGRENASLAGVKINFIHRDFFDFKHDYLFDEVITNMPVRGKKTRGEMDALYERFFQKLPAHLTKDAVIILYTNEIGFVKKQLRLHREFVLKQEYCMQKKNDFYLLIIGRK